MGSAARKLTPPPAAPVSKGKGKGETPEALMVAKLRESGLVKHAKALRFQSLTAEETARRGFDKRPAMLIPYFDASGKPSRFFRLRYLGNVTTGFGADAAKPRRYVQPKESLNEVYLPPLLKKSWKEVLADPEVPLIITEGEFKSAKACMEGLATIGLGGVEMWRAARQGFPNLLPQLAEAEWKKRPVAIIWDSDVGTKPDAIRAQRQLAYELTRRGAFVKLLALPNDPKHSKTGLDDYLVDHSAEDVKDLINESPPYEEAEALWSMNEEVALVMHPPMVLVQKSGRLMRPSDFLNVLYADRKYKVLEDDKPKVKSLAKAWLEWPQRFAVDSMTYRPGQPQITERGEWNSWRGWGVESEKGDIGPWKELTAFIFKDAEPGALAWFERWAAYPIQHPGAKLFSAVVVWGRAQGTGKTLLGLTLKDIYGENGQKIKEKHLHGDFNSWAKNKQFVIGEEITGNADRREIANDLKDMITGEEITINEKHIPHYTLPDCVNYYFTSNAPNAFFMEDADRRYFVIEVRGEPAAKELYQRYDVWRRSNGVAALRYYLEHLDLGDFDPKGRAFETQAKRDMIIDNKSDIARWCWELKENPDRVMVALANAKAGANCDLFTTAQLYSLYNPSDDPRKGTLNGLSRELKAAGIAKPYRGMPVKTRLGSQRLWAVRNGAKWEKATLAETATHWESFWLVGKKY